MGLSHVDSVGRRGGIGKTVVSYMDILGRPQKSDVHEWSA